MGFALLKRATDGDAKDSVPLKERLHAWWNGYDPPGSGAAASARARAGPAGAGGADDAVAEDEPPSEAPPEPDGSWTNTRQQLAEAIWSPGFVVPGGSKYVEKLVGGCSLTAAETMLEIGIGMGGATRTIIGKFGNYVTAYEGNAELVAAARAHAVTYDFEEKVDISYTPFADLALKSGYFRAAFLREVMFTVEDKNNLLQKIGTSLKSGDAYLITTDFLFNADDDSPELEAWKVAEGRPVYPWTEAELTKSLASAKIKPRLVEDESDEYRGMIIEAWSAYIKTVKSEEVSEAVGKEMAREGEFWARRVAALESGSLRYYRIEGVKTS